MPEARENEDGGLERLRAVVRANPRSTTFVALAHALCDAGKDEEAEDVCRQGLAQHPRLTTGQVALGRALLARGRLREAQEVLIEAAKASPDHGDAFRWLGEVVLKRGDRDRARAILEYAEELSPSVAVVGELLARAGGQPQPRLVRPKTDFEHTRVGDARALAQRMHEDPPTAGEGEERATPVVETRARTDDEPAPLGLGATAAGLRSAGRDRLEGRARDQDDNEQTEPETTPFSEPGTRRDSEGGVTAAPGPGASGPLGAPVPTGLGARWRRAPRALRYGGPVAVLATATVVLGLALRSDDPLPPPTPVATPSPPAEAPASRIDFLPAIGDGGLERLQAARAQGKQLPSGPGGDPDALAQLAMVNALLASEHGQATAADANELAQSAEKLAPPTPARRALIEGSRALAALATGRLADARAAGQRAIEAGVSPPDAEAARLAGFASGRVKHLLGDLEGASRELALAAEARAGRTPLAVAVLGRAAVALDAHQPGTATPLLEQLTAARKDLLVARLLLAEARRAVAAPAPAEDLQKDCREQGRDSPSLRSQCAIEAAVASRLAGDRPAALKAARLSVSGNRRQANPRGVAQAALVLVSLGDVDGAADALRRIREATGPAFPPRVLAELAVAASRGEDPKDTAILARASSPDARLLAARLALARGGPQRLGAHLAELDRKALEQDPDLRFLATLTSEGKLEGDLRKEIAERSDRGSSLASYVLGRHELAAGNKKAAAQWLALALKGHGDSCEAARLLLSIDAKTRPSAFRPAARIARAVRGRNGGCVHVRAP